mmetsp:Transcript_24480/g.38778  ORF Transcript_24480/g.38778 Transcript_24480/m.38778 type:complete len:233 (+) Transcript_24480:321-1019(+)
MAIRSSDHLSYIYIIEEQTPLLDNLPFGVHPPTTAAIHFCKHTALVKVLQDLDLQLTGVQPQCLQSLPAVVGDGDGRAVEGLLVVGQRHQRREAAPLALVLLAPGNAHRVVAQPLVQVLLGLHFLVLEVQLQLAEVDELPDLDLHKHVPLCLRRLVPEAEEHPEQDENPGQKRHEEPEARVVGEHGAVEALHPVLVDHGPVTGDAVQDVEGQRARQKNLDDLQCEGALLVEL